ncbi:MAG TPA: lipid II flippase MurJ [Gaiellaceae bacterium]
MTGADETALEQAAHRRRLAWSTAIFALATGLSRVLGLLREIVAKNYFGVSGPINAFTVAFQVPNLVRALVADAALSSAFVPVFSELLEKGERKRAWRSRGPPGRPRTGPPRRTRPGTRPRRCGGGSGGPPAARRAAPTGP